MIFFSITYMRWYGYYFLDGLERSFFYDFTSINSSFNKCFYLSLNFFKLLRFLSVKSTTNSGLDFFNLRLIRSIFTNILKFFKSQFFATQSLTIFHQWRTEVNKLSTTRRNCICKIIMQYSIKESKRKPLFFSL